MKKMKKTILIVVLVAAMIASGVFVYADTESLGEADETQLEETGAKFTYFSNARNTFYIVGSQARWTFRANKIKQYDRAVLTAWLYKNSGPIMSSTFVFYNTDIEAAKTITLSEHGTYYVKFTLKCYKDGVLKETITLNSASGTY